MEKIIPLLSLIPRIRLKLNRCHYSKKAGIGSNLFLRLHTIQKVMYYSLSSSASSSDKCPSVEPKNMTTKPSNWKYLKAYIWAMVGDYDPLYQLHHMEENYSEVPGKWSTASPKAVDEVLLRLYNFEKRLLVAALALLYFAFLLFLAVAIAYFKRKQSAENAVAVNREDLIKSLKQWETEFKTGQAIQWEQFIERRLLAGKVQRMVFYSPPGIMLLTLEDGSNEIVDCRNRCQKEKDQ